MRLLLVGAFAFPHDQGSQIYFQEQALALQAAGAEVELLTYGSRSAPGDRAASDVASDPVAHPLSELPHATLPSWAVPRSRRSGPQLGKPLADLVLGAALRRLVARGHELGARSASNAAPRDASMRAWEPAPRSASGRASNPASNGASREASWGASSDRLDDPRSAPSMFPATGSGPHSAGFDAILAHHAEAALVALHGLPRSRPPILYCAHTLLEQELPLYLNRDDGLGAHSDRSVAAPALGLLGGSVDRWIAARADGWIALTQASERVMSASGSVPGRRIGPPVADPLAAANRGDDARVLAALGLPARGFFLYCGNLDPYQDLPLLEQVAKRRGDEGAIPNRTARSIGSARPVPRSHADPRLPVVVATHAPATCDPALSDVAADRSLALARRLERAGLRVVAIRSAAEARALFAGARATIVPRRSLGGFPIKLVNSLAAGTPVVAYHGDEWGLVDGHEGLIADPDDPVASLAGALARLEQDPALAERLGLGARARYGAEHRPALVAAATIELIRAVLERREASRRGRQ